MNEDALLTFSTWQRTETTCLRRLRLIERWRWRAFLASIDNEEGEAPYGVKQTSTINAGRRP